MAFASKLPTSVSQKSTKSKRAANSIDPAVVDRSNRSQTVQILPSLRSQPRWLQYLFTLQNFSSIVTLLLITGMLTLYGAKVYSQHHWNRTDSQLKKLQKTERQLIAKSEILKNQIAQQAEQPNMNLLQPKPEDAIILPIAVEPLHKIKTNSPNKVAEKLTSLPLGY